MPLPLDLLTLKVVSKSRVTTSGYLCANFCLPRPLCSRLRADYATDVRQHHPLMPLPRGRGHNN